ncbi:MAG: hypothetical protein ACKVT1_18500 [Dehalococcoidia bacterium]
MPTRLMQELIDRASALPEDEQDRLAVRLLDEMKADAAWDELFARPESQRVLERLANEALREWDAGRTRHSTRTRFEITNG